jgi:hypothetical protein
MYVIGGNYGSSFPVTIESSVATYNIPILTAPSHLAFGPVGLGASASAPLRLTNTGPGAAPVSGVTITGDTYHEFAISGTSGCASVPGNGSCSPTVSYSPKHFGSSRATANIVTTDATGTAVTLKVPLSGSGSPGSTSALDTYVSSSGEHWTTTGLPGRGYTPTGMLGFVTAPHTGSNVQPIYGCLDATKGDHFLSTSSTCGGATVLRTEGHLYRSAPAQVYTLPVYDCQPSTGDRYETNSKTCSGTRQTLGYAPALAGLGQYTATNGAHWATTGSAPSGYGLQKPLLGSLRAVGPGTAPVYACLVGTNEFLSTSTTCDGRAGAQRLWQEGLIYQTRPASTAAVAVFRCKDASGRIFLSVAKTCSGQTLVDTLGFVMPQLELDSYLDNSANPPVAWASTTPPISSYNLVGYLGFLLARPAGTLTSPVYACSGSSWGEYLSLQSDCEKEGSRVGFQGWVYKSRPAGINSMPLWRCRTSTNTFRFMSNSRCSDSLQAVRLGFVQTRTLDLRAPRSLTAANGPSTGEVTLAWKPPATNGGWPLASYRIYRGTSRGNMKLVASVRASKTTFTDQGLSGGTTYYYGVIAANALGLGAPSAVVSVTT